MPVEVPEIPGGRSSEPLDLGTVKARLHPTLRPGDPAPDFIVRRIGAGGDDRIRLSDSQGKLVLVDFRASWNDHQNRSDLAAMADLHKAFGGDPRFGMITLWCDQSVETAEKTIRERGPGWPQGYPGSVYSPVGMSYKLRAWQATFLVAPDGRILAKDLRGPALARRSKRR